MGEEPPVNSTVFDCTNATPGYPTGVRSLMLGRVRALIAAIKNTRAAQARNEAETWTRPIQHCVDHSWRGADCRQGKRASSVESTAMTVSLQQSNSRQAHSSPRLPSRVGLVEQN